MPDRAEIAIIAGTGAETLFTRGDTVTIETRYGTSPQILLFTQDQKRIAFLPRHGAGHVVPPHKINYRANIEALHTLGVKRILATSAVGSLRRRAAPNRIVIPHDLLDFTKCREATFHEGSPVVHVDVTEPYCRELRKLIAKASDEADIKLINHGVYVCTEGPRYETPSEIKMLAKMGGDIVGQTGVPELILARERAICYASLCVVTNYGAGLQERLSTSEVLEHTATSVKNLRKILMAVIPRIPTDRRRCVCATALEDASFQT